jgi:hypothetical protein
MLDLFHNLHLRVYFLVQDSVLHESSLLKLLCRIWDTVKLIGNLIHDSKCALADAADFVVFRTTFPFFDMFPHGRQR